MKLTQWIACVAVVGGSAWLYAKKPYSPALDHGMTQSPINIDKVFTVDLRDIEFKYQPQAYSITDTGYFIRIDPSHHDKPNLIRVDGQDYKLVEFHFHTPSEHTIKGKRYPMEIHFVHKNKEGEAVAVGVFVEVGAKNDLLQTFIDAFPATAKVTKSLDQILSLKSLFPKDKRAYRYDGSLTTPEYLEGIKWQVMKNPIQCSKEQIAQFARAMKGHNARKLQSRNNRVVVLDNMIDKNCAVNVF